MENNKLIIGIENSKGEIIQKQDFHDFLHGKQNIEIINLYTGQKLFDILYDELGIIKFEDNKFVFRQILKNNFNVETTAIQLLGKIAEAVIVKNCNSNEICNQKWFSKARLKHSNRKTSLNVKAIGTGLLSTKKNYYTKYNITDTQRDIVWIDKNNNYALMPERSTKISGAIAGLQIKVSYNYKNYILKDIIDARYEVPIVYFDMNRDFYLLIDELLHRGIITLLDINKSIICARDIDLNAQKELDFYYNLLIHLLNGKIKIDELIQNPQNFGDENILKNAIIGSSLEKINGIDDIIM